MSSGFSFTVTSHADRADLPMIEVYLDGTFVATIHGDGGIPALKITSGHLDPGAAIIDRSFPAAILIPFET